jgi:hypothetical protein
LNSFILFNGIPACYKPSKHEISWICKHMSIGSKNSFLHVRNNLLIQTAEQEIKIYNITVFQNSKEILETEDRSVLCSIQIQPWQKPICSNEIKTQYYYLSLQDVRENYVLTFLFSLKGDGLETPISHQYQLTKLHTLPWPPTAEKKYTLCSLYSYSFTPQYTDFEKNLYMIINSVIL